MNTIRFCFTATVVFLVVAIGCRVASCMEVQGWKCCSSDRLYDPEGRFCRPAGTDGDEQEQMLIDRLASGFRFDANVAFSMHPYSEYPYCKEDHVLVNVPAVEVRELMEANPSPIELLLDYCFDLTPSDELVAQACRPPEQYCGRPGYTCVNKYCYEGEMLVDDPDDENSMKCKYIEKPFKLSVYETDAGGSPVGRSNNTVLPVYSGLSCGFTISNYNSFILTTDGKLHMEDGKWIIPETEYYLEYYSDNGSQKAAHLTALLCTYATQPPLGFEMWFIFSSSVVCLVLTLIVYATLPYLRNAHGYYIMFYMASQLMYFICKMIMWTITHDLDSPLCIPFGYFSLFATLTTCCWLNVICFDIYWMLRYNYSTNRNTSISLRTIMYHIYCWGFSSIFVSIGYLLQHSQNEKLREFGPDIGKYNCEIFTYDIYGTFIFYFLPSCGTLTLNLILFILTAIHCSRIKSELNNFQQTDSITEIFLVYKERFVMSIKLFLVFGIPFLLMMLCQLFHIKEWQNICKIIEKVYFLQGVNLFIIFVAKRKVIMEIRKKFRRSTVQSELIQLSNTTGSS